MVDCELITFGRHPGIRQEPDGLRVRVLPVAANLRRHPAHPVAPALPGALRGASLVHTHHLRSVPSRVAGVTARILGIPAVVTDHGLGAARWTSLLFHRFLPVSAYSAETLAAPADRTRVIYGGADPERFRPDHAEARAGVLFVGRFTPHKGLDRLIQALPDGAELTCVGSPGHDPHPPESGYPELLRRLAAGRPVRFVAGVHEDRLPALYRTARVLVLPSVHWTCYGRYVPVSELLGLSLLEAMASGTPVVASRLGGLPEIVRDGETGFLVQPGNVEELRDRIATLLDNRELAERMGRAARESVLDRFTWDACALRCLETYGELIRS